jgi:hypothetical protein
VLVLLTAVLPEHAYPVLWIIGGLLGAFTLFIGVTLVVALFTRNEERAERAWKILRALLAFLGAVLTFRRRP